MVVILLTTLTHPDGLPMTGLTIAVVDYIADLCYLAFNK